MRKRNADERKTKRGIADGCCVLACLCRILVVRDLTLTITQSTATSIIPSEIAQITDLHGACLGRDNQSLLKKIAQEEPDVVVSTGDMYTNGDEAGKETAVHLLPELAKSYPSVGQWRTRRSHRSLYGGFAPE